jgi:hypothetical protein
VIEQPPVAVKPRRARLSVIIRDQYGTMLPQIGEQVEVDLGFGHVTSGRVIGVYNMDIVRVELPFEALP